MSGIVVVYELDKPDGSPAGEDGPVLRVHAAPAAPGMTSVPGPRTFCGKDTFAMKTASWTPPEEPDAPWFPPQHASRVCAACEDAAGNG
ncbi:hypothetical protein [Streptomyces sp. NPDC051211]|uniref:hypothetical protein n=1 Tax=Streptomyces sp. NPDC051211 TaxID=3154643 RepID=UPI003450C5BD